MAGPGKGYKSDADAMEAASTKITELAEDLSEDNKELGQSKVNAEGFGQAHGDHAQAYTKGVQTLDAAVKGLGTTLTSFASQISGAGQAYTAGDEQRRDDISQAGGQ
ncbi:type VII secretion target [Amycolatopsis cihanbeyliensis]|uniref:Excreted virulence factor EspC (Type VII ESX diderm) n=1 Tax=Amycolatopsis cihanbeyliensis TaxID=1128664 RepID=A0A542DJE6_AMYCI|nr:type VII secretion target [Amycolatopsis cihanbeyliensis]TQJ03134.1 excreted virulence factor EspC (type VII ESX diderm) [Amycolatopsis cihanbeyliensis]